MNIRGGLALALIVMLSSIGQANEYEVGDAIYNDLDLFGLGTQYDHGGIIYMAKPKQDDPQKMPVIYIIESVSSGVQLQTLDEFDLDYGPYRSLGSFANRQNAAILAQGLLGKAYPNSPGPDFLSALVPWGSWSGQTSEVKEVRCDGLIQFCYNKSGVSGFYWTDGGVFSGIHAASMLSFYNDLPPALDPHSPCYFYPRTQRGETQGCSGTKVGPGGIWSGAGTDLASASSALDYPQITGVDLAANAIDHISVEANDQSSGISYVRSTFMPSDDPNGTPPDPTGDWSAHGDVANVAGLRIDRVVDVPATCEGWYYFQAVDGGGNVSDIATYYNAPTIPSDCPAVWIDDMTYRDGVLAWRADMEDGTEAYRVFGRERGRWVLVNDQIPARGSGSEYAIPVGAEWDTVALEEIEVKDGVYATHELGWRIDEADITLPDRTLPEILIVSDRLTADLDSYIETKRSYGFSVRFQIESSLSIDRIREIEQENSQAIVVPGYMQIPPSESQKAAEISPSVLLIAPDMGPQTQSKLDAYKSEMSWHGIPSPEIRTYILPAPYDSSLLATEVVEGSEEYVVIFGFTSTQNDPGTTTIPLPWIHNPNMTHIWDPFALEYEHAPSLWGFEADPAVDTVRKCVGYLPILSLDDIDLYNQKLMMAYQAPAFGYAGDVGIWRGDFDNGWFDPTAVVMCLDRLAYDLGPGWLPFDLVGSDYGAHDPGLNNAAVSQLNAGRSVIFMMSTESMPETYGSILHGASATGVYYSGRVSHMVSQSCIVHDVEVAPGQDPPTVYDQRSVIKVLRAPGGGAISSVGPTRGFLQAYYYYYSKEYIDLFFDAYENPGEFIRIGDLHRQARNNMLKSMPSDSMALHYAKINVLLGDPTLPVHHLGPPIPTEIPSSSGLAPSGANAYLGLPQPNPFNPSTSVPILLSERMRVKIAVFDVSGRLVRVLVDSEMEPGRHSVPWDGTNGSGETVGSGVYYYRLKAGNVEQAKRVVLIR